MRLPVFKHTKENMMTMSQIIGNLNKDSETRTQRKIIREKRKEPQRPEE